MNNSSKDTQIENYRKHFSRCLPVKNYIINNTSLLPAPVLSVVSVRVVSPLIQAGLPSYPAA